MTGRFPDFVIIGAMKCATSTLHSQLEAQPGFCMSRPKEPNFFSDPDQWARGLDWYRGLFAAAAPGDLCGESSTHYTKLPTLPDALPRLKANIPNAKLIYIMRHPIDRLVSHYSHGWLERSIDGPIDSAIERHPELVDYGRYAMQIGPWLDTFGARSVLPVFLERLTLAPQPELERICRFLGYAARPVWNDHLDGENASGNRLRDSRWRDAIVHNPLVTAIRRNFVPQAWRDRIKKGWQMAEKPMLGAQALARVTAVFDEDLTLLGDMLGTRLTCATFKSVVSERALEWSKSPRPL
jgi:hypothetical protein